METQTQTHRPVLQLPHFLCMFATIYAMGRFAVFRNWSPKTRPEASSCLISLAHGTPAVVLAMRALFSDPGRGFSAPNTPAQDQALEYSIAYFLADTAHLLLFSAAGDDPLLFLAHHAATLFVFLTCRYVVAHGAAAVLSLLVVAELTSACQNAWTLAAARRADVAFAANLHDALSLPFYAAYSVLRGAVGPYLLFRMAAFYYRGGADGVIPTWVWASWIGVVLMAISVSILWIANLWIEFFRERRVKLNKKTG